MRGRKFFAIALLTMMMMSAARAQEQSAAKKAGIQQQAAATPVAGSGTPGQLSKWAGVDGASSYTLGDSSIFEDKFGKIGIGTRTPVSKLTVVGMIETTLGGYKFPDGSVQTTAGIAPNQVVRSLNGLMGDLTLQAGANLTITPSGNTLTIAAPFSLTTIAHDTTLTGNGTSASPLGLKLPFSLVAPPGAAGVNATGGSAAPIGAAGQASLSTSSSAGAGVNAMGGNPDGPGVNATGGAIGVGVNATGGSGCTIGPFAATCEGVRATGGSYGSPGLTAKGFPSGGSGVVAQGGDSGFGVIATGGNTDNFTGGDGVNARGGRSTDLGTGGTGASASGGASLNGNGGTGGGFNGGTGGAKGGIGVSAVGGSATNPDGTGGVGLVVTPGSSLNPLNRPLAGHFMGGDVNIDGGVIRALQKLFHIDHPLDPENKFLNHVSIESSEVLNIYSGNITTDGNGDAIVTLPDWFEALNKDCRYQLTVIGTFAQAIVAEKLKSNRFAIKTNGSNVEVSWQVTGVRSDPATRKRPLVVEETKSESERGHYLNPEAYDQPEEKGINWVHYPQLMQQLKDASEKIKREKNQ